MSEPAAAIAPGRRIDLTREPDFAIGCVVIQPTACEVTVDGRRVRLQPRVMEVLVALARAGGRAVSRDTLLSVCWGDVTVGEDALNRCVQRLRRLAEAEANGAFIIETIPRLGYRLAMTGAGARPKPTPAQTRLAVMAFDNLSGDPDMKWFSDGLSEEILHVIGRMAGLTVIGRGSSFQFRGGEKSARRIVAELNATHMLDGSVRRSGNRIRVLAQLVECDGETSLWSERFDRDLSDVFGLQDEIADTVAAALRIALVTRPRTQAVPPAAYDLYLRARTLRAEPTTTAEKPEQAARCLEMLEQSVALAPDLARAWAEISRTRTFLARNHRGRFPSVTRAAAVQAVERALELDPSLDAAYLARMILEPKGSYEAREALCAKALAIAPNSPEALIQAARLYSQVGRSREGLAIAKRALDLDPQSAPVAGIHAFMMNSAGRYVESLPLWDGCRARWPNSEDIVAGAIEAAAMTNGWDRLEALGEACRDTRLETGSIRETLRYYRNLRDPDPGLARVILAAMRARLSQTGTVRPMELSTLHQLGLADECFDLAGQASFAFLFNEEVDPPEGDFGPWGLYSVSWGLFAATNRSMMSDIRFVALCAKLGLCDYWVKTGRWPDCAEEGVLPYDFKAECRRLVGRAAG